MDAVLYKPLFIHLMLILSVVEILRPSIDVLYKRKRSKDFLSVLFWTVVLSIFIGLRPIDKEFVDMVGYAENFETAYLYEIWGDYAFYGFMKFFANLGVSSHVWFLFIEFIYIGGMAFSSYKLIPYHSRTAFIIMLMSFSFWLYATNGLRSGMACSWILFALPFIIEKKWKLAFPLCCLAFSTHSSTLLPICAIILASKYDNTKTYIWIWVAFTIISILYSNFFQDFLSNYGSLISGRDAEYYSNESRDLTAFSHQGFRYDFFLYGCVPILIGWYFIVRRNNQDYRYKLLFNIYIICNSIWVLVSSSWLSNRIAYLSWFMYGLLLIFPVLNLPYVKHRNRWIVCILLGNASFTYVMWLLGKYN